jgi:hypothetical protein
MTKKPRPKRPQVSVKGETYAKIKKHCDDNGLKVGEFIDELCGEFFGNGADKDGAGPLFNPGDIDYRNTRY